MSRCAVKDCAGEVTKTAQLGFGLEFTPLLVSHEIDVPLCDEHVDITYRPGWNLTLDYSRLEFPQPLFADEAKSV